MNGFAHMLYGLIFAEILFQVLVKKTGENNNYNRIVLWLCGFIGGWLPDMDSLSGFFEALLITGELITSETFLRYHRDFTHGFLFLIPMILIIIVLVLKTKKNFKREPDTGTILHPLGQIPVKIDWVSFGAFWIMVLSFSSYNSNTMYFSAVFIVGTMILLGSAFFQGRKPLYGIIFFGAAVLHHLCDFIQCEWNPFGPFNQDIEYGFFLYCRDTGTELYRQIMEVSFEITPIFIALGIILYTLRDFSNYKKEK